MSVERETVVQLARAEMNDEYGVDFDFQGTRGALTAAEAIEIAGELVQAAYEALSAAQDEVCRPVDPAGFDLAGWAAGVAEQAAAFGGAS